MEDITVNRSSLLVKLRANRETHHDIYLEAKAGYKTAAIAEMNSMIADAEDDKEIKRTLTLVAPMDQTKDYDRAIAMLEMSVDETIKLSEYDFSCYVLDEWRWKGQWSISNSPYSAKAREMK